MSYEKQIKELVKELEGSPGTSYAHQDARLIELARSCFVVGFNAAKEAAAKIAVNADREIAEVREAIVDLLVTYSLPLADGSSTAELVAQLADHLRAMPAAGPPIWIEANGCTVRVNLVKAVLRHCDGVTIYADGVRPYNVECADDTAERVHAEITSKLVGRAP